MISVLTPLNAQVLAIVLIFVAVSGHIIYLIDDIDIQVSEYLLK
jgi:hypothetical protein